MNQTYTTESNKITTSGAWICLLVITTPATTLRYANNNSTVMWPSVGASTYYRMPFSLGDISSTLDGKFPEPQLYIGDTDLDSTLHQQIRATGGLVGSIVRIMVVHSDHLDITTPAIDESAEILSCEVNLSGVTLTLGIPSIGSKRFPRDRYVPGFCRHKFGGALCQYVQPSYSLISSSVSFVAGSPNSIYTWSGNLVTSVFRHTLPLGEAQGNNWALSKDTGFTVSGSNNNDGFFSADSYYAVHPKYVYVKPDPDRAFVPETITTGVTIRLGYNGCNHTLSACKKRNNVQNYGGSPGIVGGMYG